MSANREPTSFTSNFSKAEVTSSKFALRTDLLELSVSLIDLVRAPFFKPSSFPIDTNKPVRIFAMSDLMRKPMGPANSFEDNFLTETEVQLRSHLALKIPKNYLSIYIW